MKHILFGFRTKDKAEIGEVLYNGTDADACNAAYEKSDCGRFHFCQASPTKIKYKEENLPGYDENKAKQEKRDAQVREKKAAAAEKAAKNAISAAKKAATIAKKAATDKS